MPQFSREVPKDPRGSAFPIVRTPANGHLQAIVTSPDLIGCYTHYFKGRTAPCEGKRCEACQAGMPYRWHAYQSALTTKDHLHCLFECTAQAAENFTEYREAHGSLRGCLFQARRLHSRPNGRIIIITKPADLKEIVLPAPPDLISCLSILWGFSTDDITADTKNPEKKTTQAFHTPPKE